MGYGRKNGKEKWYKGKEKDVNRMEDERTIRERKILSVQNERKE